MRQAWTVYARNLLHLHIWHNYIHFGVVRQTDVAFQAYQAIFCYAFKSYNTHYPTTSTEFRIPTNSFFNTPNLSISSSTSSPGLSQPPVFSGLSSKMQPVPTVPEPSTSPGRSQTS